MRNTPSSFSFLVWCALVITAGAVHGCSYFGFGTVKLLVSGDSRELRERAQGSRRNSPERPPILLINLDGIDRDLLYDLLRRAQMPQLAHLLGGDGRAFDHAYFEEDYLSTLPSSTMVAWVTALTGVAPAHHGIAGNEFFIRETRQFAAPVPVSIEDSSPVIACFTDDYVDRLRKSPSVWERMREYDPDVLIWVAMQHFHAGADRLLLTDRNVLVKSFQAFIEEKTEEQLSQEESRIVFERLDEEVVDVTIDELADGDLPDVLTIYLSGTDSYAHVADEGPDRARREYLTQVVDPLIGQLADRLRERGALADRWVVVTSDHGHSEVVADDVHALSMKGETEPPRVLANAGFRVRPFELEVPDDADFQAVLAYQGAMAYVYVADRSTCEERGQRCDWTRPPRFGEDVLAVAEAFYRNNRDGRSVPALRDTLDLVLARRPQAIAADDLPFEVYLGDGKLQPLGQYLREHARPTYVELEARLRELAVGPHGERAGDVILLAHNGDRARPDERYYFATPYRSWHGSPSRRDSEIPLIVAHPQRSQAAIAAIVRGKKAGALHQQHLSDVLLALRKQGAK